MKFTDGIFFPFAFTQKEVDNALYGYIGGPAEESPAYALSGVQLGNNISSECTSGKDTRHTSPLLSNSWNSDASIPYMAMDHDLPEGLRVLESAFLGARHTGVFCCQKLISKGTRFGPFRGSILKVDDVGLHDNDTVWEVFQDGELVHFISGCSNAQNWMKYVQCARHDGEQNLILVQEGMELFYEVSKDIYEGSELLVWYGESYLKYMGIPITMKSKIVNTAVCLEGDDSFACDRCGKVFAYKYYRDKHLKYTRCVDQGDRKYPCHLCNRSFEKRDRLRIHILHVHEKHRPHECSQCGKRFSQSSSLNKHLRVHSGERPYKCPFCVKAFTASSILRTHIRQHSGEKPFKCRHCGKAFASHAAHDSHVRRTHTKEKPCVCEFCGKAFAQSYELKFHMNMHTGEKPYTCEKCGRGFSSPSSRDRHRSNFDCTTRKNRAPKMMRKGPEVNGYEGAEVGINNRDA